MSAHHTERELYANRDDGSSFKLSYQSSSIESRDDSKSRRTSSTEKRTKVEEENGEEQFE
jgi:hypothetical protein